MKTQKILFNLMTLCLFILAAGPLSAQTEDQGDKTLSPYFFVKTEDPDLEQLPLKSTSVDVHISGVIADVAVTQVYKNTGTIPLEAVYIFPASR